MPGKLVRDLVTTSRGRVLMVPPTVATSILVRLDVMQHCEICHIQADGYDTHISLCKFDPPPPRNLSPLTKRRDY